MGPQKHLNPISFLASAMVIRNRCAQEIVFMFWGLFLCLICTFSIWTSFKTVSQYPTLTGNVTNTESFYPSRDSTDQAGHHSTTISPRDERVDHLKLELEVAPAGDQQLSPTNKSVKITKPTENKTTMISPLEVKTKVIDRAMEPLCRKIPAANVDYCEIEGDIRIDANTSTIFVFKPDEQISPNSTTSWTTKPYVRWYIDVVKLWKVKIVRYTERENKIVKCNKNKYHSSPAILFSIGGQIGNYFHSFADVLFPLYATSFGFRPDVHFLASDYQGWWLNKFAKILNLLTKHPIVDIDRVTYSGQVHCYHKMVVGLKFHTDLVIDESTVAEYAAGVSMQNFRQLLREAYSLKRKTATQLRLQTSTKPRLMIISRKRSRVILNKDEISGAAKELGFEVIVGEDGSTSDVSRFAEQVNSCDVMMGVHGSGLTNMVFLPDNAVLIQLLPFGELDVIARIDYRDPTRGMNIHYLEYKISSNESTLSQQYSIDDPVLTDPESIHRQGWYVMSSVYLDNQNFTVDVGKLTNTLVQAMELIRKNGEYKRKH